MNTEHLNRFIRMDCSSLLLKNKIYPNIKEITEAVGIFAAYQKYVLPFIKDTRECQVICIGDGKTPRVAALFACLTKHDCFSIDPTISTSRYTIERLTVIIRKIEDVALPKYNVDGEVILIFPHSHAPVKDTWERFNFSRKFLINMPCCFHGDTPEELPYKSYHDPAILSKHNQISIYSNVSNILTTGSTGKL